jgi:hypothetical protein
MFRRVITVLAAVVLTAGAGRSARAAPQSAAELLDVPKLLEDLSHTDTAVRDGASEKLAAIGEPARPELIQARDRMIRNSALARRSCCESCRGSQRRIRNRSARYLSVTVRRTIARGWGSCGK